MKNIIFLDIDGVLAPRSTDFRFSGEAVAELERIIRRGGAQVVICSSWKEDTLEKTLRLLPKLVREHAVGQTPDLPGCTKGKEVQAWLEENGADAYVILDDEPEHYLPHQVSLHLVKTDIRHGLTPQNADQAIWILRH